MVYIHKLNVAFNKLCVARVEGLKCLQSKDYSLYFCFVTELFGFCIFHVLIVAKALLHLLCVVKYIN
jgi:hypothetical protein